FARHAEQHGVIELRAHPACLVEREIAVEPARRVLLQVQTPAARLHDAHAWIVECELQRVVAAIFRLAVDSVACKADELARFALGSAEEGERHEKLWSYRERDALMLATNR